MAALLLSLPAGAVGSEKKRPFLARALLIGIEQYKRGGFEQLSPMIANDLLSVEKALTGIGYDEKNIQIVTNAATLEGSHKGNVDHVPELNYTDIALAIGELAKTDQESQVVLLYLSGHGGTHDTQRHLAVWDSLAGNGKTFVSLHDIAEDFSEALPLSNKVLIADACSNEGLKKGNPRALSEKFEMEVIYSSQVFQSSHAFRDLQFAEWKGGMSLFTWTFVTALQQAATFGGDDELTAKEILDATRRMLTEYWTRKTNSSEPCPVPKDKRAPFERGDRAGSRHPFRGPYPAQCSIGLSLGVSPFVVGRR